jgi:hypothetical protein
MKITSLLLMATLATVFAGDTTEPTITGHYVEARSCDVFTGPCFANAEMGLTGKEGILVWSIQQGGWQGVDLQGLNLIAAVKTDATLGDVQFQPRKGETVLIVDSRATPAQRTALTDFARSAAANVIGKVVSIHSTTINATVGGCAKSGCAKVTAGNLIELSTRCLGSDDHLCGNEDMYYPPLTSVKEAHAAFTEIASFQGKELNVTWANAGTRSAYIGKFSL